MCGGSSPDIENTDAQKALAEVAAKRWNDYQTNFVPMENKFMAEVQELDSEKAMDEATNVAGVTNNANTSRATNDTAKAMSASGINPNSTQFKQGMNNVKDAAGQAAGVTTNKVQVSQQDRFIQGLDAVNSIGQGQQANSISGMGDVATMAQDSAIDTYKNKVSSNNATSEIAGYGVGVAASNGMGG